MNILCPGCQSSLAISESEPRIACPSCGLETDLSQLGTYPGAAPVPLVRDLTGETVGGYRIAELIGVGGMGVVYRATDPRGGPDVAIKVLNPDFKWKHDEFVARFEREARALERLDHPGIVRILASGCEDRLYYLVTEYVPGPNLAVQLRAAAPAPDEARAVLLQICDAIAFAHRHGIVHRDLKPANVVRAGAQVKVLDFGLAQVTGGDAQLSSLTRTDLALGTFNYLSPEQRTNAKAVDERSDVFSLGVILYELLTGTLPLGRFDPPSRHRRGIDRRYDAIVQRALDADPARRYQTVRALAADLERLGRRSPRRPALISAAAGIAGVAAALAWLWWPVDDGSASALRATARSSTAEIEDHAVAAAVADAKADPSTTNDDLPNPAVEQAAQAAPPEPPRVTKRRPARKTAKPKRKAPPDYLSAGKSIAPGGFDDSMGNGQAQAVKVKGKGK